MSTVSDLAASQVTEVSIIPAFGGWFGTMPEATEVSAQISEPMTEFQVAGIQLALQTRLRFWSLKAPTKPKVWRPFVRLE